jgi:hypothetical protein
MDIEFSLKVEVWTVERFSESYVASYTRSVMSTALHGIKTPLSPLARMTISGSTL